MSKHLVDLTPLLEQRSQNIENKLFINDSIRKSDFFELEGFHSAIAKLHAVGILIICSKSRSSCRLCHLSISSTSGCHISSLTQE